MEGWSNPRWVTATKAKEGNGSQNTHEFGGVDEKHHLLDNHSEWKNKGEKSSCHCQTCEHPPVLYT